MRDNGLDKTCVTTFIGKAGGTGGEGETFSGVLGHLD